MGKKIGLFGGTFDPIHFGHLNLAFELMEKKQLEEVWFIPAQINPLKVQTPPNEIDHRLAMVQLAIQGISQFQLKHLAKNRLFPSYTIDMLRALLAEEGQYPSPNQLYLLLGEDSITSFPHWHLLDEIVKLVPLLIGSRPGVVKGCPVNSLSLPICHAIQKGLTPIRMMDISSSDIRKRLVEKQYCGHLIPLSVLDYIQKHQLYQSS